MASKYFMRPKERTMVDKYTYADIIIDPNDKRLEGAIGKKVYASDNPHTLFYKANNDDNFSSNDILKSIDKEESCYPFKIETGICLSSCPFTCIIIKKEPEVKYLPFDLSKKEDREALRDKWIKSKRTECEFKITSFDRDGKGIWTYLLHSAEYLLEKYTFLDGTPVGKRIEVMKGKSGEKHDSDERS